MLPAFKIPLTVKVEATYARQIRQARPRHSDHRRRPAPRNSGPRSCAACSVEPSTDTEDSIPVLSGEEIDGDDTDTAELTGTILQSYDATSLLLWAHAHGAKPCRSRSPRTTTAPCRSPGTVKVRSAADRRRCQDPQRLRFHVPDRRRLRPRTDRLNGRGRGGEAAAGNTQTRRRGSRAAQGRERGSCADRRERIS